MGLKLGQDGYPLYKNTWNLDNSYPVVFVFSIRFAPEKIQKDFDNESYFPVFLQKKAQIKERIQRKYEIISSFCCVFKKHFVFLHQNGCCHSRHCEEDTEDAEKRDCKGRVY